MLKQRDNVRDFPGRRWLNLSLRTLHLSGIVLLGAGLLGAGNVAAGAWLVAVMAAYPSGALPMFWAILVISTLLSHAPGAIRHRRLF